MNSISAVPSRDEARQDPEHASWFIFADAVERARREDTDEAWGAVETAWRVFETEFLKGPDAHPELLA